MKIEVDLEEAWAIYWALHALQAAIEGDPSAAPRPETIPVSLKALRIKIIEAIES
jgi:hypothetical protein